jgi:hypothetical protein
VIFDVINSLTWYMYHHDTKTALPLAAPYAYMELASCKIWNNEKRRLCCSSEGGKKLFQLLLDKLEFSRTKCMNA